MSTRSSVAGTRPLGVSIICVLGGLGALIGFFGGIAAMGINPLLGLALLFLSVGQLVAVVGLWGLQTWGWLLGVALYGISGLVDLVTGNAVGVVVSLLIVLYLFTKRPLFR